jgi:hypothetical protein
MNNKLLLLLTAIAKSMMFWISISLVWLLKSGVLPSINQLYFFVPYYLLWVIITILYLVRTGKVMKIIWIGSMRNSEVFTKENLPYALLFLIGCLIIAFIQYRY